MRGFLTLLLLLSAGSATCFQAGAGSETEITLTIETGHTRKTFTRDQLLKSPAVREMVIRHDPAYPKKAIKYKAVPVSVVLDQIAVPPNHSLLFVCKDGFSAPIDANRLLNKDERLARAYLAIEPEGEPWPRLKAGGSESAGPFYLIWSDPEKSNIGKEEWPFQLTGFVVKPPPEIEFPGTQPDPALPADSVIRKGYQSFLKNCFSCHTLNGEGNSKMGPDLNIPHSPTEYLRTGFLKKLIRSPQNLRHWPQSKMAGFDEKSLPENELQALLAYLEHMAKRRRR